MRLQFARMTPQLRYLLSKLEDFLSTGEKKVSDSSQVQLEHIMPQTLSEEWKQSLGDLAELHSEYVHMLGNLTLLGYRLNVAASNQPFDTKCSEHYCKSEFALTRALTSRTSWDLEAIEERQKTLADLACSLWPRQ